MYRGLTGYKLPIRTAGEPCAAFVPNPLPPEPPATWDAALFQRASVSLGRLSGVTTLLPDPHLFLYSYIRKEALLSSQIEGTQSSLSELLLFENSALPGLPLDDVQEVSNYVAAMNHGLARLREGFPLSLRLVQEVHRELLAKGRGCEQQPGEFRRSQNWIGGTRPGNALFVPPPPDHLLDCLGALEKFLRDETVPSLVRAALAHVQFETIHPFLDGNGRVGRLLITLLLCQDGVLPQPLLYLSLYLKKNRTTYYELLQRVRETGDWEAWIEFFLTGVEETANQATETVARLLRLFQADRARLYELGRAAGSAPRVHEFMQRQPVVSSPTIVAALGLSKPTANAALSLLVKLGLAGEITGQQRGRLYAYKEYLRILSEGTEPL
ncbi:MAG: Fic family protein [Candidatus Didemnitutus sp.]|nr:Fic family protein [Candidatus Didemnitutus sp.]